MVPLCERGRHVTMLRITWYAERDALESYWCRILDLRNMADQYLKQTQGLELLLSSICGVYDAELGNHRDVYPAITYWIVHQEGIDLSRMKHEMETQLGGIFSPVQHHTDQSVCDKSRMLKFLYLTMKDHRGFFIHQKIWMCLPKVEKDTYEKHVTKIFVLTQELEELVSGLKDNVEKYNIPVIYEAPFICIKQEH